MAWCEIVQHREPVIQGVLYVIRGNSGMAARPPGGGLYVCYQDLLASSSDMGKIKDWAKREFTMPPGSGEEYSGMLGGLIGLSIFYFFRWIYRRMNDK